MIALEILLYILLLLLSILLLILLLPIFYEASGQRKDTTFLMVRVFGPLKWFYFTYEMQDIDKRAIHLKIFGINGNIEAKKEHKEKKKGNNEKSKDKNEKKKKKSKKLKKGLVKKILNAALGFFKHIRPRHVEVEGRYGFDDPYYTGLTCAVINCIAPHGGGYNVNLTPVFDGEVIDGRFVIEGRIVPMIILLILGKVFVILPLKDKIHKVKKDRAS